MSEPPADNANPPKRTGSAEATPATTHVSPPEPSRRRETFLARYPRKLKVGGATALLAVLALSLMFAGSSRHGGKVERVSIPVAVSGSETGAAIANKSPAPALVSESASAAGDAKKVADNGPEAAPDSKTATDAASQDDSVSTFMVPAPDPGLTEDSPQGSLPRIGEDGRQPWQVYARPFNTGDKRPRVSIVITGLGLSRVASDAAITRLPPNVTLAFDVQSPVVGAWCARARQAGHETLLMLPMEPFDYPRSDPGPNTLLSNLPNTDNIQRLLWALAQANGYVGVTTLSGSRFTTDPDKIAPILDVLHRRGLMILDTRIAPHSAIVDLAVAHQVPVAVSTQRLDQNLSPEAIDETLSQIEQTARLSGRAVAVAPSLPIIIDRLEPWLKQLPRDGIALAPLSSMVQ